MMSKLKKIFTPYKNIVFIGYMFVATFNIAHAQTTSQYSNSFVDKNTTTSYQKTSESYELKNGVLMPNPGESRKDYEKRRLRLKKQDGNLHKLIPQITTSQLAPLKEENIDEQVVDLIEDALQEQSNQPQFISYYSADGKKRLKGLNNN